MTDTEPLLLTRDGTVATLTINRPRRLNAPHRGEGLNGRNDR